MRREVPCKLLDKPVGKQTLGIHQGLSDFTIYIIDRNFIYIYQQYKTNKNNKLI